MLGRPLVALLALALAACAPPQPSGFVATDADFADFETWTRFDRGPDAIPPLHPDGVTTVYINQLPPPGATEFPEGTILVRVTSGGPVALWELHAMVKRGGDYNPDGARGWEFLELYMRESTGRVPRITWRGEGPAMGDGYTLPDGGVILSCNHCHGGAGYNDSVLGPELDLSTLAGVP